jgi:hypothetical protein
MRRLLITAVVLLALFPLACTARPDAAGAAIAEGREGPVASEPVAEEDDNGEDVRAREHWFYDQRAFPGKHIPAGAYLRARAQAARLPSFPAQRTLVPGASFSWTSIGPHPIAAAPGKPENAGRVTSLALQDAQHIYVGAANGGVWRTSNAGGGWAPIFDAVAPATQAIGAVTVDPNNPNTVYAGTGEGNQSPDSYFGAGLFRSTDSGTTWTKLGGSTFDHCSIARVVVEKGDPSRIGVAVVGSGMSTPTPSSCGVASQGVFLSTDAGATFHLVAPATGSIFLPAGATDLTIMPTTPHVWLAGTGNGAVWRSTDSGEHWQLVLVATGATGKLSGRVALAVSPSNPQIVAAAVVGGGGKVVRLKLSFDGGLTWPTDLPDDPALCGGDGQCWYDLAVAFDPSSSKVLYLGGVRLDRYERTSGGWAFTQVAHDLHADVHALAFDTSGLLWAGSDGGVHTWSPQTGQVISRSQDLPITEFEPGLSGGLAVGQAMGQVIGGTQDNGTVRFTGNSRWDQVRGGDGAYTVLGTQNPTIFTVQPNLDIRRSTNDGTSWADKSPPFNDGTMDKPLFYAPLVSDPGDVFTLYAGSRRLWRTTNRGDGWTAGSSPFARAISAIASSGPTASLTTTVYVGLSNGGIQQTTDVRASSPTWTAGQMASGPLPARTVTDLWVNPNDSQEAFATLSGFGSSHLLHTTNGITWTDATGNLPNAPANAVAVDSSGAFPILYVASDVGIFASADDGDTWVNASTNLPPTAVVDLLLDSATGTLIAATHGRGAYTASLAQAPPFARLSAPSTVTGPVVARFNVPVRGVAADNVVFLYRDSSAGILAGDLRCADAAGAATACATGNVSHADLQPAAPLIPGQSYIAFVNRPGPSAPVRDLFGTSVLTTSLGFRAALDEGQDSAAARYTWQAVPAPGAIGGSYSQHHRRGPTASFSFNGTSATWITVAGPDQGIARVFIDGAQVGSFDQFATALKVGVRHSFTGLTPGRHVLRVQASGQKNPLASDTLVSVDGWQAGDATPIDDPDPQSKFTWQVAGGARSDLATTEVTFGFRGTGIRWDSTAGPDQGQCQVLIDGVDQGVFDHYASIAGPVTHDFTGLPDDLHTMTVRVLGHKQPASSDTLVTVNGWHVS